MNFADKNKNDDLDKGAEDLRLSYTTFRNDRW